MRVLFASDGSRSADRARDLLAHLPWPADTRFSVVYALQPRSDLFGAPLPMPSAADLDRIEDELIRHADVTLDDAQRELAATGHPADRLVLRGRAASAIVEEARTWKADLIVIGSRGHGRIASMLLGSTSAEVVDHAPCAVLVVRDPFVESAVLAEDGSPGAARARDVVRTWPMFANLAIDVVSVAETNIPWSAGMPAGLYDQVYESYSENVDIARQEMLAIARHGADELIAAGRSAQAHQLDGDIAHEIVEFARQRPHALVVIGTRGHGGLARLVLGSVARNVLFHAAGSVLVVREPVAGATPERPRESVGASS